MARNKRRGCWYRRAFSPLRECPISVCISSIFLVAFRGHSDPVYKKRKPFLMCRRLVGLPEMDEPSL